MNIVRSYHHRLAWTTGLLVTLLAASATPAQAPADYAPMSISMEDVPYPHPVSFLEFELYGQDVRLAYMNVAPAGQTNGRTVVLLHGGNFFAEYWADTIEVLRNEGFRVIATDRIGYGRSSKPIVPYTLHDMALHTKMVLEAEGISKAAIVGHSMGGMVASRFAFAYLDITTHVALVNSHRADRLAAAAALAGSAASVRVEPEPELRRHPPQRRAVLRHLGSQTRAVHPDPLRMDAERRLAAAGDGPQPDRPDALRGSRGLRLAA